MTPAAHPPACELARQLVGRYALEVEAYEAILELAREQGKLLRARGGCDPTTLARCTALLERKEEHLGVIARLEDELAPLKRRWWAEEVPPADRARLNALLDRILATLDALVAEEERNESLLGAQRPPAGARSRDGAPAPSPPLANVRG